jgi:hypothetical protein
MLKDMLRTNGVRINMKYLDKFMNLPIIGPVNFEDVYIYDFNMREVMVKPEMGYAHFIMVPDFSMSGVMIVKESKLSLLLTFHFNYNHLSILLQKPDSDLR